MNEVEWREQCDCCGKPVVYNGGTITLWEIVPTADGGRYTRRAKTVCVPCIQQVFDEVEGRARKGAA